MLKAFLRLQSLHYRFCNGPNDGVVEADLHRHFYKIRTRTLAIQHFQMSRRMPLLSLYPVFVGKQSDFGAPKNQLASENSGDIIAGTLLCSSQSARSSSHEEVRLLA